MQQTIPSDAGPWPGSPWGGGWTSDGGPIGRSPPPRRAGDAGPVGACNDVQTDPHNCGACGHDCQSGACAAGQCQPYLVRSYDQGPRELLEAAGILFWTDDQGHLVSAGVGGGSAPVQAERPDGTALTDAVRIATDGTRVFVSTAGGDILACDVAGCGKLTELATGQDQPDGIAADGSRVYWVSSGAAACTTGAVSAVPAGGGTPQVVASLALDGNGPVSAARLVASNGALLAWSTDETGGCTTPATVWSTTGGAPPGSWQVPGNSDYYIEDLAMTAGHVYAAVRYAGVWVNDTGFAGAPILLHDAAWQTNPRRVAADGALVVWSALGDTRPDGGTFPCVVMAAPAAPTMTTQPVVLSTMNGDPWGVALDATTVYYADHGGQRIMGVAR